MPGENGMDRPPQIADALAVNDSDLKNAPLLAGGQVIRHQVLDLARLEGVQIEHPVNRQLARLIHAPET
jgi:hypothetical protein